MSHAPTYHVYNMPPECDNLLLAVPNRSSMYMYYNHSTISNLNSETIRITNNIFVNLLTWLPDLLRVDQ